MKEEYGEEYILYIDESGINSNEIAEYGWAQKGKRCHALKSGGHGRRFSMISAVKSNTPFKFITPLIFQGSCDRSVFIHWLEYLLENLKEANHGQARSHLLILDNTAIHKGKEIDTLVARYQSRIFYLPAYSPDFNPIEKAWSVLKHKVRQIVAQQNISVLSALDIAFKVM